MKINSIWIHNINTFLFFLAVLKNAKQTVYAFKQNNYHIL